MSETPAPAQTSRPNCKINLGLRVLRRRNDGYHDLATVFLPVPLCDELTIEPCTEGTGECLFTSTGIEVDCPSEDNICVKAYRLLKADYPQLPSVRMHLCKRIPFGAGLGGEIKQSRARATLSTRESSPIMRRLEK